MSGEPEPIRIWHTFRDGAPPHRALPMYREVADGRYFSCDRDSDPTGDNTRPLQCGI
jgi:hypothetical protein